MGSTVLLMTMPEPSSASMRPPMPRLLPDLTPLLFPMAALRPSPTQLTPTAMVDMSLTSNMTGTPHTPSMSQSHTTQLQFTSQPHTIQPQSTSQPHTTLKKLTSSSP